MLHFLKLKIIIVYKLLPVYGLQLMSAPVMKTMPIMD